MQQVVVAQHVRLLEGPQRGGALDRLGLDAHAQADLHLAVAGVLLAAVLLLGQQDGEVVDREADHLIPVAQYRADRAREHHLVVGSALN